MLADRMPRPGKAGNIVDMAVGMVVQQAIAQPDEVRHAQRTPDGRLDLVRRQVRIAVGIEQALARCQQPPFTIRIDGAAFQDQVVLSRVQPFMAGNRGRRFRVARHQIFPAPAIEAEQLCPAAVSLPGHDRPGVPQPDIPGWKFDDFGCLTYGLVRRCSGLRRPGRDPYRHEPRGGADKAGNFLARARKVAAPFLDKIKDDMCLDGYKSVLVGIGRTRQWALAREIVDWVRAQGLEQGRKGSEVLTSNWFVALIRRRVDDGEWEAAVEVFEYMRDFDGVPSGECIEMFARVTDHEGAMNSMTVTRCRRVGEWLAGSDAGRALWHLSFGTPGMAAPEATPSRSVRIAMPTEEFDINGDIDKLREQFKDYLE